MTINYKGCTKDYGFRVAEISYDDENEKERELMSRLAFWLERVKGWTVDTGIGGISFILVDDYEDYKYAVADYKVGKKMIKDCMKFGF